MYGPGRRMTRRPVWLARSRKCSRSRSPVKLKTPCTASWKFQGTYLWCNQAKTKDMLRGLLIRMKESDVLDLHLDGIESGHVHLHKPVLPVVPWDSGVVNAAWDVLKRLGIFEETVVFVVYREGSPSRDLQGTFAFNYSSLYIEYDIHYLPAGGKSSSIRL